MTGGTESITAGESPRLPVATPARARAAIVELLTPSRRTVLGAGLSLLLATSASLVVAPLFGKLIDRVEDGAPLHDLTPALIVLAALAVLQGLLTFVGATMLARLGETAVADLRERFVDRILGLALHVAEHGDSGDLVSRVSQDVAAIGYAARDALPQMINALLLMGLTLVALVALDWRFVLVAAVVAPLQARAARWYLRSSGPLYASARRAEGDLEAQVLETVAEAETVRALRLGPARLDRARARIECCNQLSYDAAELETRFFGRLNLAEALGLLTVLTSSFVLVDTGHLTVGTASAAALYLVALFRPVRTALMQLDPIQSATASLARVVGVTDLAEAQRRGCARETVTGDRPGRPPASISLRSVTFAYRPGTPAIDRIDLEVPAGSTVAVVGASGAGKSTLASLVAGVHRPATGTVELGGRLTTDLDPIALREAVVMVTQEVHVFAGSLADDLRLAAPRASDDDLRAALEVVGAHRWLETLPDGLATIVGAAGHRLSAVQAQAVALARVVLADPSIAVLDEATAEAGSAGARELDAAARAALRGRTGVVVAHRLSQAVAADCVVVMDQGRIVQVGRHADLVGEDGPYAALWSAWQARQEDEPAAPTSSARTLRRASGKPFLG